MIKKITTLILVTAFSISASAQTGGPALKTYRIAIFSPLFLDSIYRGGYYRYDKVFPKFAQAGFNFVQGAQIALDSISLYNGNAEVTIYDSKATLQNIPWLISTHKLDSTDLVIGAVKDAEFLQLATFAKGKNIPFISSVFPNDGGITANPFVIIVNPTLKAHCEAIYSYLIQKHGTDKIIFSKTSGAQEDKIADYFKTINESEGKPLLDIRTVITDDNFELLIKNLDSTRKNIIIGGSLNEKYTAELLKAIYPIKKTYQIELIGMPNWEGFPELKKTTYKDFPIFFTTPELNNKTDIYSRKLQNNYFRKYKASPSEMSYKGYESAYIFTTLLDRFPADFMSRLNESNRIFNEYNFKPVFLNKKSVIPDYLENKHLYLMQMVNGKVVKVI